MENELSEVVQQSSQLSGMSVFNDSESFQKAFNIGKMFASSSLVPDTYQNKPMDCTIAVDMANRMGVSPMFVMQNLYIVKGKPSWSGQACMSMIRAHYTDAKPVYTGEKGTDTWGCFIRATDRDGSVIDGTEVTIAMAKSEGWYSKKDKYGKETSKWQSFPQQMLAYRAAAFFARVQIPNALMGCSVEGEPEDIAKSALPPAPNPLGVTDKVVSEAEEQFK